MRNSSNLTTNERTSETTLVAVFSSYLRLLSSLMSLLTLLLAAGVPQDCAALQQLVELVHHPQLLQQLLPLEECVKALPLLHLFLLLLLLLLDFRGDRFHRRTGQSRLRGNGWTFDSVCFYCLAVYAFTIYLQLMSLNNLDNTVCSSYLDNKRHLNLK